MVSALPVSTMLRQDARPELKGNFMLSRVIRPIIKSCEGKQYYKEWKKRKEKKRGGRFG